MYPKLSLALKQMKFLKIHLLFCLCTTYNFLCAQGNIGFEGGDISLWQAYKNGNKINTAQLIKENCLSITSDTEKVNSSLYEPAVCPFTGMNSVRLGVDKRLNGNVSSPIAIEAEIMVNSDDYTFDYWISYYYEVHEAYYSVKFYDSAKTYHYKQVNLDFTNYEYSYWVNGNFYNRFQKWKKVSVKLKDLKGKKIKVRFEVRGCTFDAHVAYLFLDFNCGKLNESIRTYQCEDAVVLKFKKPGYHKLLNENNILLNSFSGDSFRFKWDKLSQLKVYSYDDTSCTESNTLVLSDNKRYADFDISNERCLYDTLKFINRSTSFTSFFWQLGSEQAVNNSASFIRKFNTAGGYSMTLFANDTFCSDTITKNFTVYSNHHNAIVNGNDICIGNIGRFYIRQSSNYSPIKWLFDSTWYMQDTLYVLAKSTGVYHLKICTKDSNACIDTSSFNYSVNNNPEKGFSYQYLGNNEFHFSPKYLKNNYQYTWLINNDSFKQTELNYLFKDTLASLVLLKIKNEFGCVSDTALLIQNNQSYLFVPNAFNPGRTSFKPYTDRVYNYRMEIYNRWGELLFSTQNPNEAWNGTYKGELVQQDVYLYVINCTDSQQNSIKSRGTITVIK